MVLKNFLFTSVLYVLDLTISIELSVANLKLVPACIIYATNIDMQEARTAEIELHEDSLSSILSILEYFYTGEYEPILPESIKG